MPTKVFLIHGWSVQTTRTYQALHLKLAEQGFDLEEIYLARFVTLDNEIEIRDLAKAMHRALELHLGPPPWKAPFHLITHSTGALVVKDWLIHDYVGQAAQRRPLGNLVFLAGPHFGSRLAHHGRSMIAHLAFLGETGTRILEALELGSAFSWTNNEAMLDPAHWKAKGVRPFCLTGDRVERNPFASKIFPAGYEPGSDMVVRAASGNLDFRRFTLDATRDTDPKDGEPEAREIEGVPYAALWRYTHSGDQHGILNSITRRSGRTRPDDQSLDLILKCLAVADEDGYGALRDELAEATVETRDKRPAFAQLDFRFRDSDGRPIDDYRFELGYLDGEREKPSKAVAHTHKNKISPEHFTAFIAMRDIDPEMTYFMRFRASTDTELLELQPEILERQWKGAGLGHVLRPDHTTQIDVVLSREPHKNLFVFHRGTDPDLHVKWDRRGEITKRHLEIE